MNHLWSSLSRILSDALNDWKSPGLRLWMFVLLLNPGISSCGALGGAGQGETASRAEGYYLSASLWPMRQISVCWEDSNADLGSTGPVAKNWVRDAVERQYNERTPIAFQGWRDCQGAADPANVRIKVEDVGPHTKGLGRQINRMANGMVLNFTFRNWSPSCQSNLESCVRSIAVHEFGHSIGMAHEQNRPDTPSDCSDSPQGGNGDIIVGAFDRSSVMNYCNPVYNNNGVLSDEDVATIRQAYAQQP